MGNTSAPLRMRLCAMPRGLRGDADAPRPSKRRKAPPCSLLLRCRCDSQPALAQSVKISSLQAVALIPSFFSSLPTLESRRAFFPRTSGRDFKVGKERRKKTGDPAPRPAAKLIFHGFAQSPVANRHRQTKGRRLTRVGAFDAGRRAPSAIAAQATGPSRKAHSKRALKYSQGAYGLRPLDFRSSFQAISIHAGGPWPTEN